MVKKLERKAEKEVSMVALMIHNECKPNMIANVYLKELNGTN